MAVMGKTFVEVIPLQGFDQPLVYVVEEKHLSTVQVGSLVKIPLGRRSSLGLVSQNDCSPNCELSKIKAIMQVQYESPVVSPAVIELGRWMRTYYATTWERVLETIIPAPLRKGMNMKAVLWVHLLQYPEEKEFAALQKKAPRQAEVLTFLKGENAPQRKIDLMKRLRLSAGTIEKLVALGLVEETSREELRDAYRDELSTRVSTERIRLTDEQDVAVQELSVNLAKKDFAVHLLHGVTGSGKTEVYLRAIETVLEQGGAVLFLVPEVALTSQTVDRLRDRLEKNGVKVLVWHSNLSDGERLDAWLQMARGDARVVVGARSAVFAPLQNLQLVVVDEEHEPAYKQDETPRYHGRDVAVYRSYLEKNLCILGSATPSLESFYNVSIGKYSLSKLTKRIDHCALPEFHVVDMRRELLKKLSNDVLSERLFSLLQDRFQKKEQSILFMNRRGYNATMLCSACGHVEMSPDASVPLTYHRSDDTLRCHLTGFVKPAPRYCPQCGSRKIHGKGLGTQRIEEMVGKALPHAKIVRMDADTMGKKHLYRQILRDFRAGKIDVLIGTQMIAKGLDFPNVTLVGIVAADLSLHVQDFRAAERTFQLLVQVAGRAGRGDRAGEVVVQTYTPHASPIQFARRADFDGFLEEELSLRKDFLYPPYRHLIRHLFRGKNPEKVEFYLDKWVALVEKLALPHVEIRGPSRAPIEMIRGEYRYQVWYFCPQVLPVIREIKKALADFPLDKEIIEVIDVDPMNLS